MTCAARTMADGSWYCQQCQIGGDRDEPPEDYCKKKKVEDAQADRQRAKIVRHLPNEGVQSFRRYAAYARILNRSAV